jgi:hypothetical protein
LSLSLVTILPSRGPRNLSEKAGLKGSWGLGAILECEKQIPEINVMVQLSNVETRAEPTPVKRVAVTVSPGGSSTGTPPILYCTTVLGSLHIY